MCLHEQLPLTCGVCGIPSAVSWSPESCHLHEHCFLEYLQLHLQYQALLPEELSFTLRKTRYYPLESSAQQMSTVLSATSWSPEGSA